MLRDQDQALEPYTVSAAVDIDRTIAQEASTDMGVFAQPFRAGEDGGRQGPCRHAGRGGARDPHRRDHVRLDKHAARIIRGAHASCVDEPLSAEFKVEKGYGLGDYGDGEIPNNRV